MSSNSTPAFLNVLDFGSPTGSDITVPLKAAINAAGAGGATVYIPGGRWEVSEPIVVSAAGNGTPVENCPIAIRGDGPGITFLVGNTGEANVALFQFDASADGLPGYSHYGGLYDLTLWSGNESTESERGVGLRIQDTVFTNATNVWIRGYTIGLHSKAAQDQALRDIQVQACATGAVLEQCNQVRLVDFYSNQNTACGVKYLGGPCSWSGGLLQNSCTGPSLWCAPPLAGGCWLDVRSVYCEGDPLVTIQIDAPLDHPTLSPGEIRLTDMNFNTNNQVLDATNASLVLDRWVGGPSTGLMTAVGCAIDGRGFGDFADRYDLDTVTRAQSRWEKNGCRSVGAPPVVPGEPFQDRRFDIEADLATELAEYWDAASTNLVLDAAGNVATWTGEFHATVLSPSTVHPGFGYDVALKGQPVVKFVSANSTYLDSGTLSGGTLLPGSGTDRPWSVTVLSHPVQSTGSGEQVVVDIRQSDGNSLQLKIKGNTTSADTLCVRFADHVSGGTDTAGIATGGIKGHLVESWCGARAALGETNPAAFMRVDQGTHQIGNGGFSGTFIGPINRLALGSDEPRGGTSAADANVALVIVCHVTPSEAKIAALLAYLKSRFGTP